MNEIRSFCRLCSGRCGLVIDLDQHGQIAAVKADRDHAMSQGYACIKGLQSGEIHNSPSRILHPLKQQPDGSFKQISLEQAFDEIAAKLGNILEQSGPDAVALFRGTPNYANSAASYMTRFFMKALGSTKFYSTMTIDQSAKWVTDDRLGTWTAGKHRIETADVFMCFGYNPLVSVQGGYGFDVNNPAKQLRAHRARGLKLIVIDPRFTETAANADVHLQPLPGKDAIIAAGMLRMILAEGWHDADFCAAWVPGLDALRVAVEPFTPEHVATHAGIDQEQFVGAVRIFARDSKRGIVMTGTGPDMAAWSNLSNHLIECINVICGRFNRAGDRVPNPGVLDPRRTIYAQARSPRRSWERGVRSRVRGLGRMNGEMMTCTMPEDILTPGDGQVRALFNIAGNPATVFPDQNTTVAAMRQLDLLVSFEPSMTTTARLSHYIIPPKLMFERPDGPMVWETILYSQPFAQYTPAIATPPDGAQVVDEWYAMWAIAARLGRQITFCGEALDLETPPDTEHLLDLITKNGQVPLSEVRKWPGGFLPNIPEQFVAPADPDQAGTFDVAPADVAGEMAHLAAEPAVGLAGYPLLLAVRRKREVMNSSYHDIPAIRKRVANNPVALCPDDLNALGLTDGQSVRITSEHGAIISQTTADATLRRGVVTMSHGFGGLPEDNASFEQVGTNVNLLVSLTNNVQAINGMARFSGIPVRIEALV